MYDPITSYVKQHITVTKSSQAANAILLLAAVCTAMSTFFVVQAFHGFLPHCNILRLSKEPPICPPCSCMAAAHWPL